MKQKLKQKLKHKLKHKLTDHIGRMDVWKLGIARGGVGCWFGDIYVRITSVYNTPSAMQG